MSNLVDNKLINLNLNIKGLKQCRLTGKETYKPDLNRLKKSEFCDEGTYGKSYCYAVAYEDKNLHYTETRFCDVIFYGLEIVFKAGSHTRCTFIFDSYESSAEFFESITRIHIDLEDLKLKEVLKVGLEVYVKSYPTAKDSSKFIIKEILDDYSLKVGYPFIDHYLIVKSNLCSIIPTSLIDNWKVYKLVELGLDATVENYSKLEIKIQNHCIETLKSIQ
jgi:hypothetical protein